MTPSDSPSSSPLRERLDQLLAAERSEMERLASIRGEAYVLLNWGTLLEQLRYINAL
jgi:hypothetical protein